MEIFLGLKDGGADTTHLKTHIICTLIHPSESLSQLNPKTARDADAFELLFIIYF